MNWYLNANSFPTAAFYINVLRTFSTCCGWLPLFLTRPLIPVSFKEYIGTYLTKVL